MPEQAKVIENGIEVDVIEPSFNSEPVVECDTEALATESEDSTESAESCQHSLAEDLIGP